MAAGVQQEDVNGAAEELLQAGDRPTVEKIRQRLGRGSPNTVAPLLNKWFETLHRRLNGGVADERAEVPLPLAKALLAVIKAAQRTEAEKLEPERRRLAEAERVALVRKVELETAKTALAPQLEQLRAELEGVRQERDALRTALEAKNRELVTSRSSLEAEVERAQHLNAQLERANQAAVDERRRLQEQHAATERRLLLQVEEARTEAKALSVRLDGAAQETQRAVEAQTEVLARLTQDLLAAEARNQEGMVQARERELRLQELQRTNEGATKRMQEQAAVVADLLAQLKAKDQTLRWMLTRTQPAKVRKTRNIRASAVR